MKRSLSVSLVLSALALLSACDPPRPSEQDYLSVLPGLVPQMDRDAREHPAGPPVDGPLIVDVKSFAVGGRLATLHPIDREKVRQALGGSFVSSVPDSVVLCDRTDMGSGCWVKQYGVFVHMRLMEAPSKDWMRAHVSVTTTDRRAYPTNFCERIWKIDFKRSGSAWKQTAAELIKSCDEPQGS
jgi:hypothetical protein